MYRTILLFLTAIAAVNSYEFPRRLLPHEANELKETCGRPPTTGFQTQMWLSSYSKLSNRSEAPWAVSLNRCSGILISKRHILTAAHCVFGKPLDGIANKRSWYEYGCSITPTGMKHRSIRKEVQVESVFISVDKSGASHDIAVYVLEEDLLITEDIYPVCISEVNSALDEIFRLYGYGGNKDNNNTYNVNYSGCLQTINVTRYVNHHTQESDLVRFVPHSATPKSHAIHGDSGAGFIQFRNNTAALYAVQSSGGGPNMYAPRIVAHSRWISAVTGIDLQSNHDGEYFSSYKLIGTRRNGLKESTKFWSNAKYPN